MYISFEFPYALFPKPRGNQSGKKGHIYHNSTAYVEYKTRMSNAFRGALTNYSLPKQFMLGFFNGYYKKGKQPDLDNLEGSILDALIYTGLLKDDNRECFIGGYKRCLNIGRESSLIILCTEKLEAEMIGAIQERLTLARIEAFAMNTKRK